MDGGSLGLTEQGNHAVLHISACHAIMTTSVQHGLGAEQGDGGCMNNGPGQQLRHQEQKT